MKKLSRPRRNSDVLPTQPFAQHSVGSIGMTDIHKHKHNINTNTHTHTQTDTHTYIHTYIHTW